MARSSSLLIVTLLAAMAMAGCVGGEDDETDLAPPVETEECVGDGFCGDAVLDEKGRDLRTDLLATDSVPAPTWQVGDVFEQHLYYGEDDQAGEHIITMVVNTAGGCNTLATTSAQAARNEVGYDLPILGCINPSNLGTSALGGSWDWMYQFPLTDGKTWDANLDFLFNWNTNNIETHAFTLTSTYTAAIDTPKGDFPGFEIVGVTPDGAEFLRYNYVPAVAWFSHFWMYDISTPDVTDDIIFHAMSMGTSTGYAGPYFLDDSLASIEIFAFYPPLDGQPTPPAGTFTNPEGSTYIMGVLAPIACPGFSQATLVTPANAPEHFQHQYEGDPQACAQNTGDVPPPGSFTPFWIDRPAEVGDWKYAVVGAGIYGFAMFLEAVKEVQLTLEPTPAPAAEEPVA